MGTSPHVDESLSLEQIEDRRWGSPPADATRLIKTVHALRHKPIGSLAIEDLRVLLLQQVSLAVLVPIALARLEQNPLAEGDFHPGDLLAAVLQIPRAYWQQHLGQRRRVEAVVTAVEALGNLDDHGAPHETIRQRIHAFSSSHGKCSGLLGDRAVV
ncbi:contact-dependent growth inhibition system immunity protein [Amycolatopsis sp. NEAU-NG30]|uniref:Contact-dependent growth inhibition system immunity protein n=1 Tax=Amycolatopsis melonis TaxID=3156488 RepID=A0ABV0LH64_9PSEU